MERYASRLGVASPGLLREIVLRQRHAGNPTSTSDSFCMKLRVHNSDISICGPSTRGFRGILAQHRPSQARRPRNPTRRIQCGTAKCNRLHSVTSNRLGLWTLWYSRPTRLTQQHADATVVEPVEDNALVFMSRAVFFCQHDMI